MKSKILGFLLIPFLILSGCSTYGSRKYTTDAFKNYGVEKNGLFVQFGPIMDKERSIWYLNLPPAKYDLLPIFITIVNKSNSIKKIDIDGSYLMDNSMQVKYESLSVERVVNMLQASGWVPSVLFGFTGSVLAGSAEEAKDDNFYRKVFRPRILNPNGRGDGVIFFKVSRNNILDNKFILCLLIEDLSSNNTEELKISFETKGEK